MELHSERSKWIMYEKLDKLRADLERAREKKSEIEAKIKNLEQRLKEAEESQILADVKALNLSPEQLAQFLKLAANGQLAVPSKEEVEKIAASEEQEDISDETTL